MKRKSFLSKFAGGAFFISLKSPAFASNSRLQIAAIGVGGKGGSDFHQMARHGQIVAACDISRKKLDYSLRDFPFAEKFSDYREMISQMGDQIDVLSISTPDHTHAHAAQLALNHGIHLFVQSPLAHNIWETKQLVKGCNQSGLCTQLGLQGSASDEYRKAVAYLRSGSLGKVLEVHAWTNRPKWPQSPQYISRPSEHHTLPNGLNWDAFIGPAEDRPYHPVYQPYNWRGWRAFGSGAMGDAGIHLLNLPVMGCDLSSPKIVENVLGSVVCSETFPAWASVKMLCPSTQSNEYIALHWYEGRIGHLNDQVTGKNNLPPLDLFLGRKPSLNGCLIRGSKGTLFSTGIYGQQWEVHLGRDWISSKELGLLSQNIIPNGRGDSGMKEEFIQAIRTGKPEISSARFDHISRLCEITMLGNVALLSGGRFRWDSENCVSDRTDVNSLLVKEYRQGWQVKPFN
jgi:hypothetical protein